MSVQLRGDGWRRVSGWHRPLTLFAVANGLLAIAAAVGMVFDDQLIAGAPAWSKPFKFAVSFALYSLTWAWLISLLPGRSRTLWWTATVVVAASAIEQVIIVGQVVRGVRSHFNMTTTLDSALWIAMSASIVVLFLGTLIAGLLVAVRSLGDPPLTWAIRLGIAISVTGMALGQLMPQNPSGVEGIAGSHTVGAADGTPGMPLTGWSTTAGDLRIPHFVGMHALQLIPLFAVLLTILATRIPLLNDGRVRLRLVFTAAAGYAGSLAILTWQALRGQPLIHPDAATVTAFTVVVATVAAGGALSVRFARPAHRDTPTALTS